MGSNLYLSASGAAARLRQLEIVANNLANAESVGFKADRAIFESVLESALATEDGLPSPGSPGGVYVRVGETGFDHAPGPIRTTGSPLDAAIDGSGFFSIATPDGQRYTRAGSFQVSPDGKLVTPGGHFAMGSSGPIDVSSPGARILASGGVVDADGNELGRLRIVEFEDPSRLSKTGDGLFEAPYDVNAQTVETPSILAGSLEGSNVQPVVELATLVILQRAFDASIQAMQREDQATESLIREISQ